MAWAAIVKRILSYDGTGLTTPVCPIKGTDGKLSQLSSKMLLNRLLATVKTNGEDELGYTALELGTGHVPCRGPRFHHHADWQMVQ